MTKKDYQAIAKVLKETREKAYGFEKQMVVKYIIDGLVKVFAEDNIKFNPVKFSKAIYDEDLEAEDIIESTASLEEKAEALENL